MVEGIQETAKTKIVEFVRVYFDGKNILATSQHSENGPRMAKPHNCPKQIANECEACGSSANLKQQV